jgi:adenylyl- and sulfurtransferase ThiI
MNELEQQHIANAHVLVWVGASGDNDNDDDDDEVYEELCHRYTNTPAERTNNFVMLAKVTNHKNNAAHLQTKLISQSKSPPAVGILQRSTMMMMMMMMMAMMYIIASSSESSPKYMLFHKGETSSSTSTSTSSSMEGIRFVQGENEE